MRRPLIAGNWKLHKTVAEALAFVRELKGHLQNPVLGSTSPTGSGNAAAAGSPGQAQAQGRCEVAVLPCYTALWAVAQELSGSSISLGAQEVFYEQSGAFTGAISADQLKDVGCRYVLVGHSERRQFFGETLESSQKRLKAALQAGLEPILCVGETLSEREEGSTEQVVERQLEAAIAGLDEPELGRVLLAYEPVWAIGTGQVATPEQAQEVHAFLRSKVGSRSSVVAEEMRLLYGGSVKPENAAALFAKPDIDGALVGGASLKVPAFEGIIAAAQPASR
jgi:triosephosphate isomerase